MNLKSKKKYDMMFHLYLRRALDAEDGIKVLDEVFYHDLILPSPLQRLKGHEATW